MNIFRPMILIIFMVSLFGCGSQTDGDIERVKNGVLGFDRSTTVGNALEYYNYITTAKWSSFETPQKRTIVQFESNLDQVKIAQESGDVIQEIIDDKNGILYNEQWILMIQFTILPDDQFEVSYIGYKNGKGEEENSTIDILKSIYNNEPVHSFKMFATWKVAEDLYRAKEAGFIALSPDYINDWDEARAYCQQQGGRLPRINNSDSWAGSPEGNSDSFADVMIDGFGSVSSSSTWPPLPNGYYWTDTKSPNNRPYSIYNGGWMYKSFVSENLGNITGDRRVVCVPNNIAP